MQGFEIFNEILNAKSSLNRAHVVVKIHWGDTKERWWKKEIHPRGWHEPLVDAPFEGDPFTPTFPSNNFFYILYAPWLICYFCWIYAALFFIILMTLSSLELVFLYHFPLTFFHAFVKCMNWRTYNFSIFLQDPFFVVVKTFVCMCAFN